MRTTNLISIDTNQSAHIFTDSPRNILVIQLLQGIILK